MQSKLLIVGIDPGTTLGYAVIDTQKNLVKAKSSKLMNFNSLISEIVQLGKVILVGTDKAKVPSLVDLFSVKIGGRLVKPKEDLKIEEKRILVKNYKVKNDHESDALASALIAYKEFEELFKKIKSFVNKNEKWDIEDKIIDLVVTKKISIKQACDIIQEPEQKEVKIIKKVVEKKELKQEDFLKLYDKVKILEKENYFLKKQNINLKSELSKVLKKYKYKCKKVEKDDLDKKTKKLINYKEKRIKIFDKEVKLKETKIGSLKEKADKLNSMLFTLNENYLLKKLNNLGRLEFENNKFLNIGKGDILMVKDLNIFNFKVIEKIREKVRIIVYDKKLNRSTKKLPFILIDKKEIQIRDTEYFAVTNKKEFDKVIEKSSVFEKVVEDYRNARVTSLNN